MERWYLPTNPVADRQEVVVADTSVMINLHATKHVVALLTAFPFALVITDVVKGELQEDRRTGRDDRALVAPLSEAGLLRTVTMSETAASVFAGLVVGPASETLDDGEASTLAYAAEFKLRPAIDERRALRICRQRFPALQPISTAELLLDPVVFDALGSELVAEAIFQALTAARMRVPPDWQHRVVELIGIDRAVLCPSLPASARRR